MQSAWPMRRWLSRNNGPGTERQEEARESIKGIIAVAIEVLFCFFFLVFLIGPQILNFERGLSRSPGPKAVWFRLAKFILEALAVSVYHHLKL